MLRVAENPCFVYLPRIENPEISMTRRSREAMETWLDLSMVERVEVLEIKDIVEVDENGIESILVTATSVDFSKEICQPPIVNIRWKHTDDFCTYYGVQGQAILDAIAELNSEKEDNRGILWSIYFCCLGLGYIIGFLTALYQ